jgi:transcription antitermination factor NusG
MANGWWVVQCEAQREHLVIAQLGRVGFSTYAPRIKHRSRIAWLFPTYLFVAEESQFYPVLWCPRVIRLLMCGERPARLDERVMNELHSRETRDGFVKLPTASKRFVEGQNVRVTTGAMAGHIGVYAGMSSHERVKVLLELLGRKVSVELTENAIVALDVVASS